MASMRVIASDLDFPEGPVVLPDGSVLLVEIRAQQLTRVGPVAASRSLRKSLAVRMALQSVRTVNAMSATTAGLAGWLHAA